MFDLLILAQTRVTDDGFCDSTGCWIGYGVVGIVLVGLLMLTGAARRRSERAYWERRHREAELRANDPDMAAPPDDTH